VWLRPQRDSGMRGLALTAEGSETNVDYALWTIRGFRLRLPDSNASTITWKCLKGVGSASIRPIGVFVTEIKPDNKADAGYWNSFYQAMGFRVADPADPVRQFLEKFIPGDAEGSCLEVGCFPGRFLAVGGELGYELSGIDFADRFPDMQAWLQKSGYRCGQFLNQDFFTLSPEPKFDVVMSFGFIEHFENYEAAIERHIQWLKPGGLLILEAPNFASGIQWVLHALLDSENLKRHHLPAMYPKRWANLAKKYGMTVLYQGYFGGYQFWAEEDRRSRLAQKILNKVMKITHRLQRIAWPDCRWYSPYAGLVARKGSAPIQRY
jgi:SAM-dependent methyltransferase